jgi:ABC-2 type transport system ATP-binding protein
MTVVQGEIFGFLGPNGSGKTTTIRLLIDLIRPTSGRAQILGLDSKKFSLEVRQKVGYLPGELRLYQNFNAKKLIQLFTALRPGQISDEYVTYLCKRLEVDSDTSLGRLSHGNRQKIGLVLALMSQPDLLILDEPTTGLDPIVQHTVLDLLTEVRSEGKTVFFSSHVLPDVEQICDRIGIIRKGRLVAVEQVQAVRERRVQRVRINFDKPVPPNDFESLPGVRLLDASERSLYLEVIGEADSVIKTASHHHVISLESEYPSLDEIFMSYYQAPAPNGGMQRETNE